MRKSDDPSISLRDINRVVFRHKKKVLTIFFGCLVLVLLALVFLPRKYESEAKLFVRLGNNSHVVDPTATQGQSSSATESGEREVNSIIEMIQSRALLEQVVDQVGVMSILKPYSYPLSNEAKEAPNVDLSLQKKGLREKAILKIAESLDISAAKKSTVVSIATKLDTPELAQAVIDRLVKAYMELHLKVNRTAGSYEFFDEQAKQLAADLNRTVEELKNVKNKMALTSIDGQRKLIQNEIALIETDKLKNSAALESSLAKIKSLESTLKNIPQRLTSQVVSGVANLATDGMRQRLFQLQVRQQELLAKYTENHPLVISIRQQVAESKKIVDAQQPDRKQSTSTLNPAYQQVQKSLLTEKSIVASLTAGLKELQRQHLTIIQRLKELNSHEVHISQLERRRDLLESNYQTYSQNVEKARIDQALKKDQISNVNIVQPASFVTKPVSPRKKLLLGLGLIIAFVSSISLAFICEFFDQSLKSPEDVEKSLQLPVLLSVPQLDRHQVILN